MRDSIFGLVLTGSMFVSTACGGPPGDTDASAADGGRDASAPDATADASVSADGDIDAAATPDGNIDAAARDSGLADDAAVSDTGAAATDAGADAWAPTIACDTASPCSAGVCEDGHCQLFAESGQPYRLGRCDLWTTDPPAVVSGFVEGTGALWGYGSTTTNAYVVRRDVDHWTLAFDPRLAQRVDGFAGSPSVVALLARDARGERLYRRDAGMGWTDVTGSVALRPAVAVQGSAIFVVDSSGLVHRHDATGWTVLPPPSSPITGLGTVRLAATSAALYVGTNDGLLLRWDGAAWATYPVPSALPTPPPTSVIAGDESSVFVNGTYRFDGTAVRAVAGGVVARTAAAGHVLGFDGGGWVEWSGSAWTPLPITFPPAPVWADTASGEGAFTVTALSNGYLLRNAMHVLVHDPAGDHELWADGPQGVTPGSTLADVWAPGVMGLLRYDSSSGRWSLAAGSETQSPQSPRSTFRSPEGHVYVASQIGNTYGGEVNELAGGVITNLLTVSPTDMNNLRGVSYARSAHGVVVERRLGLTTWDGAAWGGPGRGCSSTTPMFAFAGTVGAICLCTSGTLSVFDGTSWSVGAAPSPYFATVGPPASPFALVFTAGGYRAYDGTTWTTGTLAAGTMLRSAAGPSLDRLVGQTGTGLLWSDGAGGWRTSSAFGATGDPITTDGTSIVWSQLYLRPAAAVDRGNWAATRCALD